MSDLDSFIDEMNKRHAFVLDGDKSKIFVDEYDVLLKRHYYNSVSVQTFKDMYENKLICTGFDPKKNEDVYKTHANAWLQHPKRRQYLSGAIFDPSGKEHHNRLNLWRGFSVSPNRGDWDIIKQHIFEVVAAGDQTIYNYIIGWLATMIQFPNRQGEVALIMRGKKGTGKGQLAHMVRGLFGSHGLYINNCAHITGRFNHHLRDCAFIFLDEAFFAGDKQHESVLKGLITDEVLMIEGKGKNAFQSANYLSVMMASNEEWVVPASTDERRFCVVDVSDCKKGNREYFTALHAATHNKDVQAAMLNELMELDLTHYEIRDIPETEALKEQRTHSLDSLGKWWLAVLSRGFVYRSACGKNALSEWHELASTELLFSSYMQWSNEYKLSKYDLKNEMQLGKFLSEFYKKKRTRKELILGEQKVMDDYLVISHKPAPNENGKNAYFLNGLNDSRAIFCDKNKVSFDFPKIEDE